MLEKVIKIAVFAASLCFLCGYIAGRKKRKKYATVKIRRNYVKPMRRAPGDETVNKS